MKIVFIVTVQHLLTIFAVGQSSWSDSSKSIVVSYSDTCYKLQKQADLKKIPGTNHSWPLIMANGIIIRGKEINKNLIDSIYFINGPQSFEKFGNIGSPGVIYLDTRQKFDALQISQIAKESHGIKQNIIYAINGYLFADSTLKLSRKAIKKVEILKDYKLSSTDNNQVVTCISIWTITKKEIKKDNSLKLCRGVGFVSSQ